MRKLTRLATSRGTASAILTAAGVSGALAASVSLLSLTAKPAAAQASAPATQMVISLDLRDARLQDAISAILAKNPSMNIVFDGQGARNYQLVNVRVNEVPLDKALRIVARAAGATVTLDEGIYHIAPADPNASDPVKTATTDTTVVPAEPTPVATHEPRQLVSIPLKYARPSDIKKVLQDPDFLEIARQDPAIAPNLKEFIPANGGALNGVGIPKYDPNYNVRIQDDNHPANNEGTGSAGVAAGQNDPSFTAQGQRGIPGGGGGFRGPGGPGGAGINGAPGQNGGGRNLTPAGIDNIISSDADNTLIVQGDAAGIEELRQIIRLLDVAPKQVIIRAEFVRVNLNDADGFGIDWQFKPTANSAVATAVFGSGNSVVAAYASGNAVANLRATLTRSTANILQAPIISTSNNRPASVYVQDLVPIQQSVTTITPQGQQITNNNTQYIPVSNTLSVTPHINGDNSVSLEVAPQISTFALTTTGLPQVSQQGLSTFRRIANGETMVLGGFITKQDTFNTNDVPFLSKLPIIGNLFRSYDHTVSSSEVLIFLTPQIIEDRAQGVVGTSGANPAPTP